MLTQLLKITCMSLPSSQDALIPKMSRTCATLSSVKNTKTVFSKWSFASKSDLSWSIMFLKGVLEDLVKNIILCIYFWLVEKTIKISTLTVKIWKVGLQIQYLLKIEALLCPSVVKNLGSHWSMTDQSHTII